MFLLNSRLGLFTAAHSASEHPFSRSYGVILPSSFTIVLPHSFGLSPPLTLSVCCTGTYEPTRRISWQCEISNFAIKSLPITAQVSFDGFTYPTPSLLGRTHPVVRIPYPSASPHCSNVHEVVQEYQPVIHRLRLSASA